MARRDDNADEMIEIAVKICCGAFTEYGFVTLMAALNGASGMSAFRSQSGGKQTSPEYDEIDAK